LFNTCAPAFKGLEKDRRTALNKNKKNRFLVLFDALFLVINDYFFVTKPWFILWYHYGKKNPKKFFNIKNFRLQKYEKTTTPYYFY